MSVRSRPRSVNSHEEEFEPLQAFLLKNTTVYAYPRQRRCPRNRTEEVDSVKAICQRFLYFLVFYTILGLGSKKCYLCFNEDIQVNEQGNTYKSALQMNPGLSHIPNPDIFSTLLYFRTREPLPYYRKSDELAAFLHAYQDNTGSTELEDCVQEGGVKQDPERPCTYDLNAGGPCNIMNGFGFDTAQACFVLKMGRIYGWLPDPIDEFATGVLVKCSGVTEDDTYNLGVIRYYDMDFKFSAIAPAKNPGKLTNGSFHSMFFPYKNQLAYLQPLVFVLFDGVKRNTFIRVRCWLIAKNIKVDFEKGEGSTQFEIIYD
ncbi:unnamed protein product [Rodentolepis nana]|uniref:Sodium/potassium-transporting ATPase subunit beta n=1 Tax=Rodentolepis nana TaxID=102285 RepID=A0A158QJE9_RODNA|nr:unnamed protein product [Rodentolepis nana]